MDSSAIDDDDDEEEDQSTRTYISQKTGIKAVIISIIIKIKCSRYRPGVAQRVGRGIALLFRDRGTRRGVSGQQHAPAALYPRERHGTHFTGGWVGPRAGLDGWKISPHRNSIPGRLARSSVAIPTEPPAPY